MLVAVIIFVLAAFGISAPVSLIAVGLAVWAAAALRAVEGKVSAGEYVPGSAPCTSSVGGMVGALYGAALREPAPADTGPVDVEVVVDATAIAEEHPQSPSTGRPRRP